MTKEQANQIKKIIKSEVGNFTVYFNSKKGELRYTVAEWYDYSKSDYKKLGDKNTLEILNALESHGLMPKYRNDFKRYQGFINCRYIVFE